MTDIVICTNKRYMNYGYISKRALCSMAPKNCPCEVNEVRTLQTGKRMTLFYCSYVPPVKEPSTQQAHTSCQIDGS